MIPTMQMGLKRWRPQKVIHSLGNIFRRNQSDRCGCDLKLPTRREQLKSLKHDAFDVLVIGGGAVGCGCALEAASRGLKTALIEADDFGSGASCKSSKLVEGGSSYLQAAIQGADLQQIFMLQQVLNERATMLRIAPHLNRVQPMLMPIYSPLQLPFYWLGLKLYDVMAGKANVRASHFLSQEETLCEFPLLRRQGLLGSLVYYDGQMDDARMCLALALTAAKNDATIANYVKLRKILPNDDYETVSREVIVEDTLKKKTFVVKSRCLINATGAGTDLVRKLDDCTVNPIALPKLGTHIALPSHYGSPNCGLLFPNRELEDETLFMLPFENRVLVGGLYVEPEEPTCPVSASPKCEEVDCLLDQTRKVLDDCALLRPDHVLSAWSGVMPSILCPNSSSDEVEGGKQQLVPHFLVEVSGNQMITLAGGRWSSYRVMASDAIDAAIEHCCLEPQIEVSSTQNLLLDGAEDYCSMLPIDLVQNYELPMDVAQHLADSYGCNAYKVLLKTTHCDRRRLHPHYPYITAEVDYACEREYACQLTDIIARRLRVAFIDASAAFQMLPKIMEIMATNLSWDEEMKEQQLHAAKEFLMQEMGLGSIVKYTPFFTGNKKPKKKKQKEKDNSLTVPNCNICSCNKTVPKPNGNIYKAPTECIAPNSAKMSGQDSDKKSSSFEILGGPKSCQLNCQPESRRDFGLALNTSTKMCSDLVERRCTNSLTNRILKFQTGKHSPKAEEQRPKSKKIETIKAVRQSSNYIKDTNFVRQHSNNVFAARVDGIKANQGVYKEIQSENKALFPVVKITDPIKPPKGIATHTITGTEINRKTTPSKSDKFQTERDFIIESYGSHSAKDTPTNSAGTSDKSASSKLTQNTCALNTNTSTARAFSRNNSPVFQSQSQSKIGERNLNGWKELSKVPKTPKELLEQIRQSVKENPLIDDRNSTSTHKRYNKTNSSYQSPMPKTRANNSAELKFMRKNLEAQILQIGNQKVRKPVQDSSRNMFGKARADSAPEVDTQDSMNKSRLFVKKLCYPIDSQSAKDDSFSEHNDQRYASIAKTPAMRLQTLINKGKYNAKLKNSDSKGLISSNTSRMKTSSRSSSRDRLEDSSLRFASKSRLFTEQDKDRHSNISSKLNRVEPNPKLK